MCTVIQFISYKRAYMIYLFYHIASKRGGFLLRQYDVIIIGAATAGSFFARHMAERGHRVLVLEKLSREKLGRRLDIFHVGKEDFARYGLPQPKEGEPDWAFEFHKNAAYSPMGKYPKRTHTPIVGMHMPAYISRLNRWAEEAGARILYGAEFEGFLYEDGRVAGVHYTADDGEHYTAARIVADCSGIPSAARRALPDGYGVENFEITPSDMFYVILRYVKFADQRDYIGDAGTRSWTYYKTWIAPDADPAGGIIGIGANHSFDYAEQVYETFTQNIDLPPHQVVRVERGVTPYRRPPYSFVADGFITMGDAACLTKPNCGEGVTSALTLSLIAADVIDRLLKADTPLCREALWPINKRYVDIQGAKFAAMLATLIGAVSTSAGENEFFFQKDIIFNQKSFESMGTGEIRFSASEMLGMGSKMLWGVLTRRLRIKTIRALMTAAPSRAIMTDTPRPLRTLKNGRGQPTPCGDRSAAWPTIQCQANAATLLRQRRKTKGAIHEDPPASQKTLHPLGGRNGPGTPPARIPPPPDAARQLSEPQRGVGIRHPGGRPIPRRL